jgi:8-oxo-dGTP pyrophosphatase MutT (NUDIX family)
MKPDLRYYYPMKILAEIDRSPGLVHQGRRVTREAVRAIIFKGDQLLMIHSDFDGDYKFPGGGIKAGEDHLTALTREVNEESGAVLLPDITEYGKVIEYDHPIEKQFALFVMTSYYYNCRIESQMGIQHLEGYEMDLGFRPEWISISDALAVNQTMLKEHADKVQRWVRRETQVLQILLNEYQGR